MTSPNLFLRFQTSISRLLRQRKLEILYYINVFISGISAGGGSPHIHEDVITTTLDPGNITAVTESVGQPYFDNNTKREYTAAVGQPAYLHCRVKNLADRAVSDNPNLTQAHKLKHYYVKSRSLSF